MHYDVHVGSKLGQYEITGELGRGGAGTVFKARSLVDGKVCALKTLTSSTVFNEEIHKRFVREISVAQRLQHENIVAYYDCDVDENVLFYAMELVPWGSLGDLLSRRQILPWREAVECGVEICNGLEYLHQNDIVHRDLKPVNIFLSDDGHLKLGDFGLARDLGADCLTVSGLTVGTAKYLAPEQAMAKDVIDGRTDLYALGCLLFEMIAGRPPYISDVPGTATNFMELMGKHVKAPVPSVLDFAPNCPQRLAALITQLLAKRVEDRPESAAIVATMLQSILTDAKVDSNLVQSDDDSPVEEPKSLTRRLVENDPMERKVNVRAMVFLAAIALFLVLVVMLK